MQPPSNLRVEAVTSDTVLIKWDQRGTTFALYEVYVSDEIGGNEQCVARIPGVQTMYLMSGLRTNSSYIVHLSARARSGEVINSPQIHVFMADIGQLFDLLLTTICKSSI